MKMVSKVRPESSEGIQYHISARLGEIGDYVFLPGDPDRVPRIAKFMDSGQEVSSHREHRIWTAVIDGIIVSACSTSIGCPAAAIAVEELFRIGADIFTRVGSCGSLTTDLDCGDLAISTAAVRLDGISRQYDRSRYPAAASHDVTLALISDAEKRRVGYRAGYTASADSFCVCQGRPSLRNHLPTNSQHLIEQLRRQHVITMEMETSTKIHVNRHLWFEIKREEDACRVADEVIRILSRWDNDTRRFGEPTGHLASVSKSSEQLARYFECSNSAGPPPNGSGNSSRSVVMIAVDVAVGHNSR